MGLAQSLRAVVAQFGGAEDDYDDYDDDALAGPAGDEPLRDDSPRHSPRARERSARPFAIVRPPRLEFTLVTPQDFDAAQEIAERLRADRPVIVDLQGCEQDLAKRLTDFCSGLAYALEGWLQCIGDDVVLLVPHDVELSSEAPGGLQERRFFNQV